MSVDASPFRYGKYKQGVVAVAMVIASFLIRKRIHRETSGE